MPNMDGTGPRGLGSISGRGLGPCGCGQKRGFGRGFGNRTQQIMNLSKEEQKKILEAQLKDMASQKQAIESRINELN
ncbi:MAG: DUF5320 domain-containing protein [archaeon]